MFNVAFCGVAIAAVVVVPLDREAVVVDQDQSAEMPHQRRVSQTLGDRLCLPPPHTENK
jgi:hypothetical protein